MNKIGVYGLGVMGKSLAANILSKGFSLSVCTHNPSKVDNFLQEYPTSQGFHEIKDFINSLEKPRKIVLMVTAGDVVDSVCAKMEPYLDKGDILIDCGNSFFQDTERRIKELAEKNLHFIGSGVSGGEKGALLGPSIMPSGDANAYAELQVVFEAIAAHNEDNSSCCTYIGKGGSGHFVKMVHNGVEYADMQLIAETYDMLKEFYEQDQVKIQNAFKKLQAGKLNSYLFEITCNIFDKKEGGDYLLDKILDVARQKGTGKWTAQVSLDYGVPIPSIIEAVQARFISSMKEKREVLSKRYVTKKKDVKLDLDALERALYLAKICIYAQGFDLIQTVSQENNYEIDMKNLGVIWQNGCIIKSEFLKELVKTYTKEPSLQNLLLADNFTNDIKNGVEELRELVLQAKACGLYIPVLNSTLDYFDGLSCNALPTNMIQAQRDYFGAHTYERIDQEGTFHTEWE